MKVDQIQWNLVYGTFFICRFWKWNSFLSKCNGLRSFVPIYIYIYIYIYLNIIDKSFHNAKLQYIYIIYIILKIFKVLPMTMSWSQNGYSMSAWGNEFLCKHSIENLQNFTNNKFKFRIIWDTRNVRSLFPLKDRVKNTSCVVYQGTCSCGLTYSGETNRNACIRWNEHDSPSKNSEPSKHVVLHPIHEFTWSVVLNTWY